MKDFPDLQRLVNPKNVAVIGASPRQVSQGARLYENLTLHSNLTGKVYAVNPAYDEINGQPCWKSVAELPRNIDIDVALIIINAKYVLQALRDCAKRGIPFAIIMSSGFSEASAEGAQLETEIRTLCEQTGLHVYGPNCPGFVNIRDRLGMTFSPSFKDDLHSGTIGLATQGGGLGRNLLQGLQNGVGVGLWFSPGNEVDLEIADFIAYMANDPKTKVIGVLLEGVNHGKRLVQALKMAQQRNKPVVILKVGHSEAGIQAVQSHTAAIAGSAEINSAIFRQCGAIEVRDLDELLAALHLLAQGVPKAGTGLCIFTFSGGTAALAADIVGSANIPLAKLTSQTQSELTALLPDFASIVNPIDTTADILRDQSLATQGLEITCKDQNVGAILYPIPMDYGEVTEKIAQSIVLAAKNTNKPIIPVWMSRRLGAGFHTLDKAGLLPLYALNDAIKLLKKIWPTEGVPAETQAAHHTEQATTKEPTNKKNQQALSEYESKQLLRQYKIPLPDSIVAKTAEQAAAWQAEKNIPVVMKILSPDILHKTDIGAVRFPLENQIQIRQAFEEIIVNTEKHRPDAQIDGILVETMLPKTGKELMASIHQDATYGQILTIGFGGVWIEILKDVTHRLLPISDNDINEMVNELRHKELLQGARGQSPSDVDAFIQLVRNLADFAYAYRHDIQEVELNPIWVGAKGQGAYALDALIIK